MTDFGSLQLSDDIDGVGEESSAAEKMASGKGDSADAEDYAEIEMIVPADEHFTRCPVSHETFVPEWDPEEGDYMYRNAVKVLVTQQADPRLYEDSCDTGHPAIKYAIVHQKLVMEGAWTISCLPVCSHM